MLIRSAPAIKASEITPKSVFLNRRQLLASAGAAALLPSAAAAAKLTYSKSPFSTDETPTPLSDVTSYNNFYEFGTDKSDPAKNAHTLTTSPWSVKIDGMVERPGDYALEDLINPDWQEERIYRFRCVEAWSMVIPWVGVELNKILALSSPMGSTEKICRTRTVRRSALLCRGNTGSSRSNPSCGSRSLTKSRPQRGT